MPCGRRAPRMASMFHAVGLAALALGGTSKAAAPPDEELSGEPLTDQSCPPSWGNRKVKALLTSRGLDRHEVIEQYRIAMWSLGSEDWITTHVVLVMDACMASSSCDRDAMDIVQFTPGKVVTHQVTLGSSFNETAMAEKVRRSRLIWVMGGRTLQQVEQAFATPVARRFWQASMLPQLRTGTTLLGARGAGSSLLGGQGLGLVTCTVRARLASKAPAGGPRASACSTLGGTSSTSPLAGAKVLLLQADEALFLAGDGRGLVPVEPKAIPRMYRCESFQREFGDESAPASEAGSRRVVAEVVASAVDLTVALAVFVGVVFLFFWPAKLRAQFLRARGKSDEPTPEYSMEPS